jgi:hypothetical protein
VADDIVTRLRYKQQQREPWDMNKEPIFAEAADEIERLRAAIDSYLVDTDSVHQPEWASEQAKANGKEPWCCAWCGPQDGGWPCGERISLDELKEARRG